MKIYWRKLYARISEGGDEGQAIISYKKSNVYFDVIDRGPHPDGRLLSVPVGWYHKLTIDLLFLILTFRWDSGETNRQHRMTMKQDHEY